MPHFVLAATTFATEPCQNARAKQHGEQTAARLPLIVHQAIDGDTKPLAEMEDDPATPRRYGVEEVKYLANGRQVIVPHAGRFTESTCTHAVTMEFLAIYDVKSIDTSCLKAAVRPPFAIAP